ncbi:MAG: ATP synthase F0 subunit C [Clostridia bacterium]|nr:ATP synthase F0 subunit C [Clostridia bacterium]
MKKSLKRILALLAVLLLAVTLFAGYSCFADTQETTQAVTETQEETETSSGNSKAVAAAACVAVVAAVGAVSMGFAIAKASDGISRQPEADGKIRTTLMLGLVFIETAIIYALIVAILIIFVL